MQLNSISKPNTLKAITVRAAVTMLAFAIGMALATTAMAQQKAAKPGVFYAVSGNGLKDTSYLFGTYHLIKSSYLDQLAQVSRALKNTRGLVVEVVIDSTKLGGLQAYMVLKGKTLSSLLNDSFRDSLETELKQGLGVGLAPFNQFKPINITLTLSLVYLMKNNAAKLNQYHGATLDVFLADEAKKAGKTVTPLETIEEQMGLLFNHQTEAEQVKDLKMFVRNKPKMIQLGDDLLAAWIANDMERLQAIYAKTVLLSGSQDYLVKDRNKKWMSVLPALMQNKPQFVAVGALHLAGADGLVQQLRNMGYTVTHLTL